VVIMYGSGDLISVTNFWSRLWGWILGEFALLV
jgi:hypothetical protein